MISKAQFDSIQMNATTRRIAEAEMAAAESFANNLFAITARIAALFGAKASTAKSAYASQAPHRA
jgi:hypothetical protein